MKTGIFFDGNHTFRYLSKKSDKHWPSFDFDNLIQKILSGLDIDQTHSLIFKGWYQGIASHYFDSKLCTDAALKDAENVKLLRDAYIRLKKERVHHLKLIEAGLEPIFLELADNDNAEKGVDVALSVSAINKCHNLGMECAILVTNDGDFEPLLHNINKYGVRTYVVACLVEDEPLSKRLNRSADCIKKINELNLTPQEFSSIIREPLSLYSKN